jgi:hypothetical protein
MLEVTSVRKLKINLSDYDSEQDISNRTLMSHFSDFDIQVLGEILFSSLKISLKKLARSLDCSEEKLLPILQGFHQVGLLSLSDDNILVNKEIRKSFEFEITRFDPHFKPDMEFLQKLLRKVPIHHLPTWHAIPRTSNNIFESIVEKYLLSPHIFHRYLNELHFNNPKIALIIADLFASPLFKLTSSDVISKYNLSRREFEEILLLLEFSFVCCLVYEKEDDHWIEYIAPFYEWHQYLLFVKETEAKPIKGTALRKYPKDFSFIEDMTAVLEAAKKGPISLKSLEGKPFVKDYFPRLISKLCMTKLAEVVDENLRLLEGAKSWLNMSLENKALYLYRHPFNKLIHPTLPPTLTNERHVREAEKTVKRAPQGESVFLDEFLKGALVPLSENSVVMLKKTGKQWKYTLPSYSEEEITLLKTVLLEWLFETGMTIPETCQGRECFSMTSFGTFFFDE